jgi:hypothetical protein
LLFFSEKSNDFCTSSFNFRLIQTLSKKKLW